MPSTTRYKRGDIVLISFPVYRQAHATRAVTRRMAHAHRVAPEAQRAFPPCLELRRQVVKVVHRRLPIHAKAEHQSLLHDLFVQEVVGLVQPDGHAERRFRPGNAGDVVEVGMRQEDRLDRQRVICRRLEKLIDLVARIDDDPFTCFLAADYEAVLEKRGRGPMLENHFNSVPQR